MKQTKQTLPLILTVLGGTAGAGMMALLYATGIDHKGLLIRSHPAFWGIWVLTLAMGIALAVFCRKLGRAAGWQENFPRSAICGLLTLPAAALFLLAGVQGMTGMQALVPAAASLLSGIALLYTSLCRFRGTCPNYLAFCVPCIYFGIRLVSVYRLYSADPQLMDYCFYLMAQICLMLLCYRLAFCANGGSCAKTAFFSLAAAYLCLLSLPMCPDSLFMGVCALFGLANLPISREEG